LQAYRNTSAYNAAVDADHRSLLSRHDQLYQDHTRLRSSFEDLLPELKETRLEKKKLERMLSKQQSGVGGKGGWW
jgi:hypothetical protein